MTAPTLAASQFTTGTGATLPAAGTDSVLKGDLLVVEAFDSDASLSIAIGGTATWADITGATAITTLGISSSGSTLGIGLSATNSTNVIRTWWVLCTGDGTVSITASTFTQSARRLAYYAVRPAAGSSARSSAIVSGTHTTGGLPFTVSYGSTPAKNPGFAIAASRQSSAISSPTVKFDGTNNVSQDQPAGDASDTSHSWHALFNTNDAVNAASGVTFNGAVNQSPAGLAVMFVFATTGTATLLGTTTIAGAGHRVRTGTAKVKLGLT